MVCGVGFGSSAYWVFTENIKETVPVIVASLSGSGCSGLLCEDLQNSLWTSSSSLCSCHICVIKKVMSQFWWLIDCLVCKQILVWGRLALGPRNGVSKWLRHESLLLVLKSEGLHRKMYNRQPDTHFTKQLARCGGCTILSHSSFFVFLSHLLSRLIFWPHTVILKEMLKIMFIVHHFTDLTLWTMFSPILHVWVSEVRVRFQCTICWLQCFIRVKASSYHSLFSLLKYRVGGSSPPGAYCLSVFLGRPFGPGLSQSCGCPLNGCPFSALMGPLWTPANTTAIIAGKASGDLACYCPGQLERKKALTMTMNERKIETRGKTFLICSEGAEPPLSGLDLNSLLVFDSI